MSASAVASLLIRLPHCPANHLAALAALERSVVPKALHELEQLGWSDWVVAGSVDLAPGRRFFVREQAVAAHCEDWSLRELRRSVPIGRNDVLRRLANIEITDGVNAFCAELATYMRSFPEGGLHDARSLPLAEPPDERWWLNGTAGYVCLRSRFGFSPALVAWDRAAAPNEHRSRQMASWLKGARATRALWGPERMPPLLIVAPSEYELRVWERALERAPRRSDDPPLRVILTERNALQRQGIGAAIWRRGGGELAKLVELMHWADEPGLPPPVPSLAEPLRQVERGEADSIQRWAPHRVTTTAARPGWHHAAALTAATNSGEHELIEWVERHRLLAAAELSWLLRAPAALLEGRLEWLLRCHVIRVADVPGSMVAAAAEPRYVITEHGRRALATRAGVPASRFGAGEGAGGGEGNAESSAGAHPEHQIGLNRFMAQLAHDLQRGGGRLAEWRNEAESQHRFRDRIGRPSQIRPDATAVLRFGGRRVRVLVEYDRGTLDGGDLQRKLDGYRRYYESGAWRQKLPEEPLLLFVCASDSAERRVLRALERVGPPATVLMTTEWRYRRWGVLGDVWRSILQERRGPLAEAIA